MRAMPCQVRRPGQVGRWLLRRLMDLLLGLKPGQTAEVPVAPKLSQQSSWLAHPPATLISSPGTMQAALPPAMLSLYGPDILATPAFFTHLNLLASAPGSPLSLHPLLTGTTQSAGSGYSRVSPPLTVPAFSLIVRTKPPTSGAVVPTFFSLSFIHLSHKAGKH